MSTETTTRQEHLDWCKRRALEYVDAGDYRQAATSMMSDLKQHPDTQTHIGIDLGVRLLFSGLLSNEAEIRRWIVGFN